jgi:transcriptional regulator of arginine metabolism
VESVVRSQQLVIVKTTAGGGQGVAAALDAAHLDQIVGSIAGDDTILVVTDNDQDAEIVRANIEKFRGRH